MFKATIFTLGVFSNSHQIDFSLIWSLDSFDWSARSDVGIEVQLFPEGDIEWSKSFTDGGLKRSLESIFIFFDCFDGVIRNKVTSFSDSLGMDGMVFELDGDGEGVEDSLYAMWDLRTDAIAWEHDHFLFIGGNAEF